MRIFVSAPEGRRKLALLSRRVIVPIGSRVPAETFRINVPNASDAVVTKEFYPDIVKDLRPTATVTFSISCGGNKFKDKVAIRTLDERSIGTIKS